jgi:hypothetical protein
MLLTEQVGTRSRSSATDTCGIDIGGGTGTSGTDTGGTDTICTINGSRQTAPKPNPKPNRQPPSS